jgi:hypothetical protein
MLLGSDGLEYDDLSARFQRKPARNDHNQGVLYFRQVGKDPLYTRVWSQAFRFAQKNEIGKAISHANACASKVIADREHERRLDEDRRLFGHPDPRT